MRLNSRSTILCATAILSLGLTACGGGDDASGEANVAAGDFSSARSDEAGKPDASYNLSDGPDVCFREITKHLGADTKVTEVTSFFSSGSEIDPDATEPAGKMTICTVDYQNPDDPRKLLQTRLDLTSGTFSEPAPVEISVMGGNAAEFRLEDHVIALSDIDAGALSSVMDAQKAELEGVYSNYVWSGVRLSGPDAFSSTHTLRLDIDGRLAANDIKQNGYASITTDGKTIKTNHLMP